ncbi:tetratricopeptide repeat protein [Motilimonas cestriensis]|uniref:Tetratricopeptide repeat protein n=1 Tax=Motilimonas cestriensis TaxID=2742685 RepID=A0ABS8WCA3_9GAMM|nr:heme biosynthesis HemY N-terminal domain-containing protein [Motilimonas cestriensis]MCE2596125.1 tetratricopeptide repeat protein [Motilimonas cestriensis]
MIKAAILVAIIIAGLIFGPEVSGSKGYVLVAMGDYTIETSVSKAIIIGVLFYLLLLGIEWLLHKTLGISRQSYNWLRGRNVRKARKNTYAGMLALAEGDYKNAERLTANSATHSDTPLLNYLAAAEAAQEQGDNAKRDTYLKQAQENSDNSFAIGLTQAKFHLRQGQYEEAHAALSLLHNKQPKHQQVLKLLSETYQQLDEWQKLLDLLPSLRKAGLLAHDDADQLELTTYAGIFKQLAKQEGSHGLQVYWNKMSRKLKAEPSLIAAIGEQLITLDDHDAAKIILLNGIKKSAPNSILAVINQLKLPDYQDLINSLESGRKKFPASAALESAYAQCQLKAGNIEQAIKAYQAAIELTPNADDYYQLGLLLEQQGVISEAQQCFKRGLALSQA